MNTFTRTLLFLATLLLGSASAAFAAEPIDLFNGHDLAGWTKRGGNATYTVEDGCIVGHSAPDTSNTFLCTDREFGDFSLEADFAIYDRDFNSGFQIRSHSRPENGGDRVFGYQIEIDPRADRKWTAGLYFEGGSPERAAVWLQDLTKNDAAREAFELGEWNHVRIVAQGRHIQSWLNGVPAADYSDTDDKAFTPTGFIGLQVHAVGKSIEPKVVRFKNLQLMPLD
jgi:3-keto-disaccharide hydrolase